MRARALRWLAQREHTRAELQRKLVRSLVRDAARDAARDPPCGAARSSPRGAVHDDADPSAARDADPDAPAVEARHDDAGAADEHGRALVVALLDEFEARGWLSDARAAEALCRSKAPRYGARKVEQLLHERGVAAPLVAAAVAQALGTEALRARQVWQRKFGTAPATPAERARQQRFLLARGFDAATVQRLMRELVRGGDGAPDNPATD